MLKIRITFVDNLEGRKEDIRAIEELKYKYTVLNESRIYKGRGGSKYSNIYLDVESKRA